MAGETMPPGTSQDMAALFQPEPIQWGLRGDPYLWADMAATLAGTTLPATAAQLDELLQATFERLVGTRADSPTSCVFVDRYSHGGMSSGRVSLVFWQETGLPLLRTRYGES